MYYIPFFARQNNFSSSFCGPASGNFPESASSPATSTLPFWTQIDDQFVSLTLEVPGLTQDQIEISAKKDELKIGFLLENIDANSLLKRKYDGKPLKFSIGKDLDADGLEAQLHQGLLEIKIPILKQAEPRKISIKN